MQHDGGLSPLSATAFLTFYAGLACTLFIYLPPTVTPTVRLPSRIRGARLLRLELSGQTATNEHPPLCIYFPRAFP